MPEDKDEKDKTYPEKFEDADQDASNVDCNGNCKDCVDKDICDDEPDDSDIDYWDDPDYDDPNYYDWGATSYSGSWPQI